ncbi:MAG: hypothetical protein HYT93_05115 [Parcubacteria group bacterium]|nr:hypothetical protein [Parcubacteria group bacterium]
MEKEPKNEQKEHFFEKADLKVKESVPGLDLTWGINFRAKDKKQNIAYNRAIEEVSKKHKLGPFHQVGWDNELGYQQWDFWRLPPNEPENNRKIIENIFQEIHTRAQEIFNEREELGFD